MGAQDPCLALCCPLSQEAGASQLENQGVPRSLTWVCLLHCRGSWDGRGRPPLRLEPRCQQLLPSRALGHRALLLPTPGRAPGSPLGKTQGSYRPQAPWAGRSCPELSMFTSMKWAQFIRLSRGCPGSLLVTSLE